MSTVIATSILPDSTANDTLTIGAAGDSVVIGGNLLTMNTLQDAGGNAIFTSDGSGNLSGMNSGFPGAMIKISEQTVSNQASVSFTSGLDSTYDVYRFRFIEINPATDATRFQFQCSTDGGDNYDTILTSTTYKVYNTEAGSATLAYDQVTDQAQGTSYQDIQGDIGSASDECGAGELYLFAPSSTTSVKHFYSTIQAYDSVPQTRETFAAGYFNTTDVINAISFKMLSGNMDGIIAMYGFSKS